MMGTAAQLTVSVKSRAARDRIIGWMPDGTLGVSVTAPPIDGAANERVIELIADVLGVAKSRVTMIAGATSRTKRLRVDGRSGDEVKRLISVAGSKTGDRQDASV